MAEKQLVWEAWYCHKCLLICFCGSATIPLIVTKNINHNARVECVNFPANIQASVSKASNGLVLTLKR